MSTIVMLGGGRSGSSLVVELLGKCSNVTAIDEPFKPRDLRLSEGIYQPLVHWLRTRHAIAIADRNELASLAQASPELHLAALKHVAGSHHLFFKCFREHLPYETIKQLFLHDPSVLKIVLKRNPLHMYISLRKAEITARSANFVTTDLRVRIDPQKFINFHGIWNAWFERLEADLKQFMCEPIGLQYEEYAGLEPWDQLAWSAEKLRSRNVDLVLPKREGFKTWLQLQDRSPSVSAKVSNFDELNRALEKSGLAWLIS